MQFVDFSMILFQLKSNHHRVKRRKFNEHTEVPFSSDIQKRYMLKSMSMLLLYSSIY